VNRWHFHAPFKSKALVPLLTHYTKKRSKGKGRLRSVHIFHLLGGVPRQNKVKTGILIGSLRLGIQHRSFAPQMFSLGAALRP